MCRLIYFTYDAILIKIDCSSHCYDVIFTHQKLNIDKFRDFPNDIDFNSKTDVFRDLIYFIIINMSPGARRALPVGTNCPPAALRNQAKRGCLIY